MEVDLIGIFLQNYFGTIDIIFAILVAFLAIMIAAAIFFIIPFATIKASLTTSNYLLQIPSNERLERWEKSGDLPTASVLFAILSTIAEFFWAWYFKIRCVQVAAALAGLGCGIFVSVCLISFIFKTLSSIPAWRSRPTIEDQAKD